MKKLIFFSIVLTFTFVDFTVNAENTPYKPDTIKIKFSNNVIIEIASINAVKTPIDTTLINNNVKAFLYYSKKSDIQKIIQSKNYHLFNIERINGSFFGDDFKEYLKSRFRYKISITEIPDKQVFFLSDDASNNFNYYNNNILDFSNQKQSVTIYFKNTLQLDELLKMNISTAFSQITDSIKSQLDSETITKRLKTLSFTSFYNIDDDGTPVLKFIQTHHKVSDLLSFSVGGTLENIKGSWVGGFSASLGLKFGKKGVYKDHYGISYNWMYDFTSPKERNINHFLSLNYSHNPSTNPKLNKWYGISFGYLIKQQGSFFKKNTMRLGINRSFGMHFSLEPLIYFNGFFKDVYPGIKIDCKL